MQNLPNIVAEHLATPTQGNLTPRTHSTHPPRILLLYGSLRERSFSRLVVEESARLLEELVKFTLLTRDNAEFLVDRYSERKESAEKVTRCC